MKRSMIAAALFALGLATSAAADTMCWIDSATGGAVPTIPDGLSVDDFRNYRDSLDRNHSHATSTGRTFVKLPGGDWIDAATGQAVPTTPADLSVDDFRNYRDGLDRDHAHATSTGKTFVRVLCPPVRTATSSGPHAGAPRTGPYVGFGGQYFFEPGAKIGIVDGLAGWRFWTHFAVEAQVGFGVTKETFDDGTYRDSTGISYSVVPYAVGIVPVAPGVELFGRAGYGLYHFHTSSALGATTTESGVGVAAFGGGATIAITTNDFMRATYTRLRFDNGSGGNTVGLSYVHRFGRKD